MVSSMGQPCVLALVSGGLDSLLLIRTLLRQRGTVLPLYLRYGLRWEAAELFWLRRWLTVISHPRLETLQTLSLPLRSLYGQHWSLGGNRVPSGRTADAAVYLPGRNVLLCTHGAIFAAERGVARLAVGVLAGNPFGDATPRFLNRLSTCLQEALNQPMRITAPLRTRTKADLIAAASREPLHLTFSCLRPHGRRHCGRCNKCAERQRAFRRSRQVDPTLYAG